MNARNLIRNLSREPDPSAVELLFVLTVVTIAAVVFFDFTNGFHDASNMISTLVASRAISPAQSVLLVGSFTLLGPLIGGTAVANTIGSFVSIEDLQVFDGLRVLLCGLLGAIGWNLLTWWLGLPSSSSHALVGGLTAAVTAGYGADHVVWGLAETLQGRPVGIAKVILALVVSPLLGFVAGYLLHRLARLLLRAATPAINRPLRRGQWLTAAALAFSHGTNDGQKGMGVITLILVLTGHLDHFAVPFWVMALSAATLTLGTTFGGWRIVRTVGFGLYKLRPLHGLNVQLASGAVIFGASLFGGPVSTTHVVSTSIMGVGASERPKAVRWQRARDIVLAWLLTIPGAGVLALLFWWLSRLLIAPSG
ncbi:MAG: inorganic phosphate transporter [Pseudomonadales bacterium]